MHNPEIKDIAVNFIKSLNIKFTSLSVEKKDERIWVNLKPQADTPKLIGYRGQNINAMQTLLTLVLLNKGLSKNEFVVFDIDGYKEKKEEKIISIVKQKIQNIEKYDKPQVMPFLGAQERRMVHLYIQLNQQNYVSESFTDENDKTKRVLKISKKSAQ